MTFEPGGRTASTWRIRNPRALLDWAFGPDVRPEIGVAVLEFIRDRVGADPDFGEVIAPTTRGEVAPGTDVEVIWVYYPGDRSFEVVTPYAGG